MIGNPNGQVGGDEGASGASSGCAMKECRWVNRGDARGASGQWLGRNRVDREFFLVLIGVYSKTERTFGRSLCPNRHPERRTTTTVTITPKNTISGQFYQDIRGTRIDIKSYKRILKTEDKSSKNKETMTPRSRRLIAILALLLLKKRGICWRLSKNCADNVHLQIIERHILHEMVKIMKKKDVFGELGGKYPQYYAAYNELRELDNCNADDCINLPPREIAGEITNEDHKAILSVNERTEVYKNMAHATQTETGGSNFKEKRLAGRFL
ncbi:hypothetical protein MRB53_026420 [Persea americana]|uniref:Uncharacterized protein n=1 Tax=Persea americana TaxID=3435 RepID=A0ACC2LI56_PERAE|nr:hypothetical protein MRB53_026420 [Persea americana]